MSGRSAMVAQLITSADRAAASKWDAARTGRPRWREKISGQGGYRRGTQQRQCPAVDHGQRLSGIPGHEQVGGVDRGNRPRGVVWKYGDYLDADRASRPPRRHQQQGTCAAVGTEVVMSTLGTQDFRGKRPTQRFNQTLNGGEAMHGL